MTVPVNDGALVVALPAVTDPVNLMGDESDKHITMNWFGPAGEIPPELLAAITSVVSTVAMISTPFEADVAGVAVLGESAAKVLLLESAELVGLRELLMTAPPIAAAMSAVEQFPTWTPHITLSYGEGLPSELPKTVLIDSLGLWLAGDKKTYALSGSKTFEEQFEDGSSNENLISDDEDEEFFGPSTTVVLVKDPAMVAAGLHTFDESLHPRDRNGRFIKKFGIVKYLVHGNWGYGTVQGIYDDHGQTKVTATPSDLGGTPTGGPDVSLVPDQIYTAPKKKAHLNIDHTSSKKVGSQAGSNEGGFYDLTVPGAAGSDDQKTVKYYVKKPKTKKHGQNEELANDLYTMAGVLVPSVDTGSDGNTYSEIIPGVHDMQARINAKDKGWMEKVQRDFAVDAWLGNRDVFGLTLDNIMTTTDGTSTPVRIDNGGALLFRAMGAPKTDFGSTVTELDAFRQGKKKQIYGPGVMSKESELDGAERVLAISPGAIDDMVTARGLPKSLADTLKARRAYIANYYGLALPESMKPDTPEVSTSAPLVDPADLSSSHGKSRHWHQMKLNEVGFISEAGDTLYLPESDEQIILGVNQDNHSLLTTVQTQSQWLTLFQEKGPQAPAMVKKWQSSAGIVRADHGEHIDGGDLAMFQYERGDKIIDNTNGDAFYVMGVNVSAGSLLLRKQKGEGEDKALPFLYDTKTGGSFTMERWDPPTAQPVLPIEEKVQQDHVIEPADIPDPEPAVPTGLAVEASKAVKADLVEPLPSGGAGLSPDAPTAPESPSGVGMLIGDGNMAEPNDDLVSKVDGKTYTFVKKKGPYAIVTSQEFGDDQNKLLTKKASTMTKKGATAQAIAAIEAPKSANGKVPGVGQHAVAKDGHEGEITMISPDGKFVFITDANGKKKRKSVGTVTITGPQETTDTLPSGSVVSPDDEFKSVADWNIVAGDQISANGVGWLTVDAVSGSSYLLKNSDGDPSGLLDINSTIHVMHKPGLATPADEPAKYEDWEQQLLDAADNPMDIPPATSVADLPGGYTPEPGEKVFKYGDSFYSSKVENQWHQINSDGTLQEYTFKDSEFGGVTEQPDQEMVFGTFDEPYPGAEPTVDTIPIPLKAGFGQLAMGDQFEMSGHQVTLVGYPTADKNSVVAVMLDGDEDKIVPLYSNSIHPDTWATVTTGTVPTSMGSIFKAQDVYENAWKTSDQLQAEKDLVGVSYGQSNSPMVQLQVAQQGLDLATATWVMYDPDGQKFYSVEQNIAKVWDPESKSWGTAPGLDSPLVESLPVVSKPDEEQYFGYEPMQGDEIYTVGNEKHGTSFMFVKNAGGSWFEIDNDGLTQQTADPEFNKGWGAAWNIDQVYPKPTPDAVNHGDSGAPTPAPPEPTPAPPFHTPSGYDPNGKTLAYKTPDFNNGYSYEDTGNGYLWEKTAPDTWQMVHYDDNDQFTGLGGLTYDDNEIYDEGGFPEIWNSSNPSVETVVDTVETTAPENIPSFDVPEAYDPTGKTLAKMSNGGVWEKQGENSWAKVNPDGTLSETNVSDYVIVNDALDIWYGETVDAVTSPVPPFDVPSGYDPSGKQLAIVPNGQPNVPDQLFEKQGDSWIGVTVNPADGSFSGYMLPAYAMSTSELMAYSPVLWDSPTPESLAPATTSYKGYTPVPGDKVLSITSPSTTNLAYWVKPAGGDKWVAVQDDGSLYDIGITDAAIADVVAIDGWAKQEVYGFDSPSGGGTFNGYTTPDNSTVIKTTAIGPQNGEVSYFVTAPGWTGWHKVENGTVDMQGDVYDNDIMKYALDDGFASVVQGSMPDAVDTPSIPTGIEPGAKGPKQIKGADAYLANSIDPMTPLDIVKIDALGQLEEGQTLWKVPFYGGNLYVQNNTGEYHQVLSDGSLNSVPMYGFTQQVMSDMSEVKFTPSGPPTVGAKHVPPFTVPPNFDPTGKKLIHLSMGDHTNIVMVQQPGGSYKMVDLIDGHVSGDLLTEAEILAPNWKTVVKWDGTNGTSTTPDGTAAPAAATQPFDMPADYNSAGKTLIYAHNTGNDTDLVFEKTGDDQYKLVKPAGYESVTKTSNEIYTANEYTNITEWQSLEPLPATTKPPAHFKIPANFDPTGKKLAWTFNSGSSGNGTLYAHTPDEDGSLGYTDGIDEHGDEHWSFVTQEGDLGGDETTDSLSNLYDTFETWDGNAVAAPAPAPEPPKSEPAYPGSAKPDGAAVASWGGSLTKDGYIPTSGMYVTGKGPMKGQITSVSKDKTKATVITSDGKKTTRLIEALTVDSGKNYQVYAAPPAPANVPKDMPIAVSPPSEAIKLTMKDGKWRPILSGSGGIQGGEMIVTSVSTPSGKKVGRVHFTLTQTQLATLVQKVKSGPAAPPPVQKKGDWENNSKQSQLVKVGDAIPMRKSSTDNPDGTPRWKVDPGGSAPTHVVTDVQDNSDGTKKVTLTTLDPINKGAPAANGTVVTSNFHPNKSLSVYTWDPEKLQPLPPPPTQSNSSFTIGATAAAQGWTKTMDGSISAIEGGTQGKLMTEPGQTIYTPAVGWTKGKVGLRKVSSDGVVIEITNVNNDSNDSANGMVAITLPEGADETMLGGALVDVGVPYTPVTQDTAKIAARQLMQQMLSSAVSQGGQHNGGKPKADINMGGWSDEKLFKKAGENVGIDDLGWQDVYLGVDESTGKVSYFWSARVQEAMAKKVKIKSIIRVATKATPDVVKSQVDHGTANGMLKRTAGMFGGSGVSATADTLNNAAYGSFGSGYGGTDLPAGNPMFGKSTGMMIYSHPLTVLGRIADYRVGGTHGDVYGAGGGKGADHMKALLTQSQSQDMMFGGGLPGETVSYVAVKDPSVYAKTIKFYKDQGITHHTDGRKIEDVIINWQQRAKLKYTDLIKPPYYPPNARSIVDLPVTYSQSDPGVVAAA